MRLFRLKRDDKSSFKYMCIVRDYLFRGNTLGELISDRFTLKQPFSTAWTENYDEIVLDTQLERIIYGLE